MAFVRLSQLCASDHLALCSSLFSALALTEVAMAAKVDSSGVTEEIKARLACQIQNDMHLYDLQDLQATDDYELQVTETRSLHFNFCKQVSGIDTAESWCLSEDDESLTFAYLKDTEEERCYPLTGSSLYPTQTVIEDSYSPKELTLTYESDAECPFIDVGEQNLGVTFWLQCQKFGGMEHELSSMSLVDSGSPCIQKVLIIDETGCPVLSMPAFTIFMDQWPWIMGYSLIALGAYMLLFGRKYFVRILAFFTALVMFGFVSLIMSINGYWERKIEEGPTGLTIFLIILILTMAVILGFATGVYLPHKIGLVFMCIINAFVISTIIYSFLMSFTGTWIVLCVCIFVFSGICIYLPLKFEIQMTIQTTSFLGSWMLVRGISLMIGGYPDELQMLTWLHEGYVLSTTNAFLVYLVAIVLLFLIGQRTQRAQLAYESEEYRRMDEPNQDSNPAVPTAYTEERAESYRYGALSTTAQA